MIPIEFLDPTPDIWSHSHWLTFTHEPIFLKNSIPPKVLVNPKPLKFKSKGTNVCELWSCPQWKWPPQWICLPPYVWVKYRWNILSRELHGKTYSGTSETLNTSILTLKTFWKSYSSPPLKGGLNLQELQTTSNCKICNNWNFILDDQTCVPQATIGRHRQKFADC